MALEVTKPKWFLNSFFPKSNFANKNKETNVQSEERCQLEEMSVSVNLFWCMNNTVPKVYPKNNLFSSHHDHSWSFLLIISFLTYNKNTYICLVDFDLHFADGLVELNNLLLSCSLFLQNDHEKMPKWVAQQERRWMINISLLADLRS